jgi:hypothetical protein
MMHEKNRTTGPNSSDKLVARGLWNPELVALITDVIGSSNISRKQSTVIENESYHYLEWSTRHTEKSIVMLEVRNGAASLQINLDRTFRPPSERIALEGVAARHSLKIEEYRDIDLDHYDD